MSTLDKTNLGLGQTHVSAGVPHPCWGPWGHNTVTEVALEPWAQGGELGAANEGVGTLPSFLLLPPGQELGNGTRVDFGFQSTSGGAALPLTLKQQPAIAQVGDILMAVGL